VKEMSGDDMCVCACVLRCSALISSTVPGSSRAKAVSNQCHMSKLRVGLGLQPNETVKT
jgi:hypothetical protein